LKSTELVEILEETTPKGLVLNCLAATLKALTRQTDDIEDENALEELNRYTRKALIQSWSGGGTVMGFGAEAGQDATASDPMELTLQTLQKLLDEAGALARKQGYDRIVLLLNNLDHIDEAHFFDLLHDLRDTLLGRDPYLFIFSSPIGLRRELATTRAHRRISERIETETVRLEPLSRDQVKKVIDNRGEAYRLSADAVPPVPETVIDVLYRASHGEIRYVLNRANGVAKKVAGNVASAGPIDESLAIAALADIIRTEVESLDLTDREWDMLEQIAPHDAIQTKDYEDFGLNSPQSLSKYLTTFYDRRLLERTEQGRERLYTPRGDVRLYFTDSLAAAGD
jgi:hypothetical protein